MNPQRIHLSKADVTEIEEHYVLDALRSGWIAPLGPHVEAFESEVADFVGVKHALALSSGTAALHMGLLQLGVGAGTYVVLPSLTFAATANAVIYTGATPYFVDSSWSDGNVDETLLIQAVNDLRKTGAIVSAALPVDIFGRLPDYDAIEPRLAHLEIPVLEDAAESLGATYRNRPAGSFGRAAAISFNGNKIMTTSGGGMLLSNDESIIRGARKLSNQAREPHPWYEHHAVGYNYRMSNILAALGRGQLTRLDTMIARRREIRSRYVDALHNTNGITILGHQSADVVHNDNCWLTCIVLSPARLHPSAHDLVRHLNEQGIEARHLWKPLHLQRAFDRAPRLVNGVAESLFNSGLALPSGSSLSNADIDRVIDCVIDYTTRTK